MNKTVNAEKVTAIDTGIKSRQLIKQRGKTKNQKKDQSQNKIREIKKDTIKTKGKRDLSIKLKDVSYQSKIKIKQKDDVSLQKMNTHDYNHRMRLI